jgi:hypothetical protein
MIPLQPFCLHVFNTSTQFFPLSSLPVGCCPCAHGLPRSIAAEAVTFVLIQR